jgi:membrane protein CcdC involved in cytochrome C biogenesis
MTRENNAIIQGRFTDLLEVLDARATVNIFVKIDEKEQSIKTDKVFEIIADREFMKQYKNFDVIGLGLGLITRILIQEDNWQ